MNIYNKLGENSAVTLDVTVAVTPVTHTPANPAGWTRGRRVVGRDGDLVEDPRLLDGPMGYRVVALVGEDGWQYAAWGPVDAPEMTGFAWVLSHLKQEHYARGEAMPQRSPLLGVFATGAQARAACLAHAAGEPMARPAAATAAPGPAESTASGADAPTGLPAAPGKGAAQPPVFELT
jgi:hypothetical protein